MTGHLDAGLTGDERANSVLVEIEQRDRALAGQPRHDRGSGGDDFETVGQAQRAGDDRGGHLAHGVADDRVRMHAVGAPQLGQRQLQTHQHRLNLGVAADGQTALDDLAQREADLCDEHRLDLGQRVREGRFVGQQLTPHARPLRTLPRVDEHRARLRDARRNADHARGTLGQGQGSQPGQRLLAVAGCDRGELGVLGAVVVEGVRDLLQRHLGAGDGHPVGQHLSLRGDPLGRLAGDDQRGEHGRCTFGRHRDRCLLDDDVGVGAPESERRDPRPARPAGG